MSRSARLCGCVQVSIAWGQSAWPETFRCVFVPCLATTGRTLEGETIGQGRAMCPTPAKWPQLLCTFLATWRQRPSAPTHAPAFRPPRGGQQPTHCRPRMHVAARAASAATAAADAMAGVVRATALPMWGRLRWPPATHCACWAHGPRQHRVQLNSLVTRLTASRQHRVHQADCWAGRSACGMLAAPAFPAPRQGPRGSGRLPRRGG